MKKVFFDANIVVDILAERQPWFPIEMEIISLSQQGQYSLYCSLLSLGTAFYLLEKEKVPLEVVKNKVGIFTSFCPPIESFEGVLTSSLQSSFSDLEDAMQYYSALSENCDTIITRNKKDFAESTIQVLEPQEFLDMINTVLK